MKKVYKETEVVLRKSQEKIKKYANRKKKRGKRISSRKLGTFKHKGFKVPNARKKIGKTDKEIYWTLLSKENNFNKCNRTRFAEYSKNTSSSQCQ